LICQPDINKVKDIQIKKCATVYVTSLKLLQKEKAEINMSSVKIVQIIFHDIIG